MYHLSSILFLSFIPHLLHTHTHITYHPTIYTHKTKHTLTAVHSTHTDNSTLITICTLTYTPLSTRNHTPVVSRHLHSSHHTNRTHLLTNLPSSPLHSNSSCNPFHFTSPPLSSPCSIE